jgi:two-component system chemotaxis sensor kinase CheA
MIRNALDHGIEDPDARVAAGKPRQGRLLLAARHEGEYVVIEMSDDGAGINSEKVKEKALKRQLITESEAGRMGDAEMTQLLFKPGFSTSDIITDVSGRGVGMDVVKTKVEELKGMVYLRSAAGKGTTVTLKVPLTLAMSRVMFVRAAGQLLAIPTTSMQEAVLIQRDAIKTIEGREAYVLRGHAVPLVGLDSVLGLDEVAAVERDRMPVVIIDLAGTRVGFVVDEMVGEHEVVIKALGPHLAKVGNIAGATILGSGEVVLILNPPDLIGSAALHYGHHSSIKAARSKSERKQTELRILVVDDSSTIRELEKGILLTAGYSVDEAVDGVDALAKVKKFKYDLMLVDIQMPRMDGLAFTKRIKGDSDFADIPIIIMTTLEKDEDKRRGIEAGADAYMVKKAFDQANLLSVIEQLTAA